MKMPVTMAFVCLLVLLQLVLAVGAGASQITHTYSITPATETDWVKTLAVDQYNGSPSDLVSIQFTVVGYLNGDMRFENMSANPSTVTMNLSALVALKRPDSTTLVSVQPTNTTVDAVPAFDGNLDWGTDPGNIGPLDSGRSHLGVSNSATNSFTSTATSDLAAFTGSGKTNLMVTAVGTSYASGSGNLISWFTSLAKADVTVTYNTIAPEPGSMLALCTGLIGIVGLLTRRKH